MSDKLKTLLTIAGSDPMGGAGIQADIRVGIEMGVHVITAITALTSQNSKGLIEVGVVDSKILKSQLEAIMEEVIPDAVKIGMIGSLENMAIIESFLNNLPKTIPVVIDPVLYISSEGINSTKSKLYYQEIKEGYISKLFSKATVVTPNLKELELLTGNADVNDMTLERLNTKAAVIKGGHSQEGIIKDKLLSYGNHIKVFTHEKKKCKNLHGSGCVFSSLMACFLINGEDIEEAFFNTCHKIKNIINKSDLYSLGTSNYGPLNINSYKI